MPPIGILETEKSCRAVVIRRFVARSESRGDEEVEVWLGARHGEEEAQESVATDTYLQQHLETGFAKRGKEPPIQEKAVSRTTNLFIILNNQPFHNLNLIFLKAVARGKAARVYGLKIYNKLTTCVCRKCTESNLFLLICNDLKSGKRREFDWPPYTAPGLFLLRVPLVGCASRGNSLQPKKISGAGGGGCRDGRRSRCGSFGFPCGFRSSTFRSGWNKRDASFLP